MDAWPAARAGRHLAWRWARGWAATRLLFREGGLEPAPPHPAGQPSPPATLLTRDLECIGLITAGVPSFPPPCSPPSLPDDFALASSYCHRRRTTRAPYTRRSSLTRWQGRNARDCGCRRRRRTSFASYVASTTCEGAGARRPSISTLHELSLDAMRNVGACLVTWRHALDSAD